MGMSKWKGRGSLDWIAVADIVGGVLLLVLVIAICIGLAVAYPPALSPDSPPALYVEWPVECAYGWVVKWEYNGIATPSMHETKEQALRLYAVLAGRMVGSQK